MTATEVIAGALNTEIVGHTGDANGGRITREAAHYFGGKAIDALEEAGYAVVKLPEERRDGHYGVVSIEGDEILIDRTWCDGPMDACIVASQLLRAAWQLDHQLAEENP